MNGFSFNADWTSAASPSWPLRKSTGCVATRMRTLCEGSTISVIPAPARSPQSAPPTCPRPGGSLRRQPLSRSKAHPWTAWRPRMEPQAPHRRAPAAKPGGPSRGRQDELAVLGKTPPFREPANAQPMSCGYPANSGPRLKRLRHNLTLERVRPPPPTHSGGVRSTRPKNSNVSSTEKLHSCSKTGKDFQKSSITKKVGPRSRLQTSIFQWQEIAVANRREFRASHGQGLLVSPVRGGTQASFVSR